MSPAPAIAVALALLATAPGAGAAERPFTTQSFRASKQHPLVILAPREGPLATIRIQFNAGSYDDAHRSGLTKLAQQAILGANASGNHARLLLDVFAANGRLEVETGVRESVFTLTAPARDFKALAKRLATMCLAPRIVTETFEEAKSRALQSESSGDLGALVSGFARAVMSDPGFQNDPEGDKETIRTLSADDVAEHLAGPMSPANATVIVTGQFNPGEMRAILSQFKGGRARQRERPIGDLAGNYHLQSYLELHLVAYPLAFRTPRAVAAAHLAGALLQERIQRRFRKMGIAYATLATPIHREWLDAFIIVLPIHAEETVPVAGHLDKLLEEVRNDGISSTELERNRAFLLEHFRTLDRDPPELAAELGTGAGDVEWLSPAIVDEVKAMTREALLDEVGRRLRPDASIHVEFSPRTPAAAARSAHE